jgi:hemoglobin
MQQHQLADIDTAADIDRLVEAFYARALTDGIIGFFFTDIASIDLKKHLPVISAFWQLQLLGIPGYRGQTFARHADLHRRAALTPDHFHRWLYLFEVTVDELFRGERANRAKLQARKIARSLQRGLNERQAPISGLVGLRRVERQSPNTSDD